RRDVALQARRDLIGEAFVKGASHPGEGRRSGEDQESHERVAKRPAKDGGEFVAEEIPDDRKARRFAAIDGAVRAPDQMVQIIYQALVAHFYASDGQVRRRAAIEPAEFAHLFAAQVVQAKARGAR